MSQTAAEKNISPEQTHVEKITFLTLLPQMSAHIATVVFLCFSGFSWFALGVGIFFYYFRMFGISAGYHRYFSHRSYKANRFVQFLLAWIGCMAVQRGPLWWASTHRIHHKYSDQPEDVHSPIHRGFWWSHIGWLFVTKYDEAPLENIKDFTKYPELRWLEKWHFIPPILMAIGLFVLGGFLEIHAPVLETNALQLLTWGFFVSTVALYHGTFTVNSICHLIGTRPYKTDDQSRNNILVALITMGEGWHNNHHHYQASERQGIHWWQIDMSHYVLWFCSKFRIVRNLKSFPKNIV